MKYGKIKKPQITSSIYLRDKINLENFGFELQKTPIIAPSITAPPVISLLTPPLVCLITPPHSGIGFKPTSKLEENRITQTIDFNKEQIFESSNQLYFPPGRRIITTQNIEFCRRVFGENYFYFPNISAPIEKNIQNKELRAELRDIFGESDISD